METENFLLDELDEPYLLCTEPTVNEMEEGFIPFEEDFVETIESSKYKDPKLDEYLLIFIYLQEDDN
jgi:hypothetical protein